MSPENRPPVAIVSVTYNRCEPLLTLLAQVRDQAYPPDRVRVFLVDNASTDDSVDRVMEHFPDIRLIRNDENSGVAAGFNMGLRAALAADWRHDYIWLLDSDAEVDDDTLATMVSAMEADASIGVIGSAVYDPVDRERLVAAGLRMDWREGQAPPFVPAGDEPAELLDVELIPACSLLIRTDLCRTLGLWDERFRLYWGDTDWCARAIRHGHRVCCHARSRVWHRDWAGVTRGFGAPGFIHDHLRGALLFNLRHNPQRRRVARRLVLTSAARGALEQLTMRHELARAYEAAVRDLLAGSFGGWSSGPAPADVEQLCRDLAARVGPRPRAVLGPIADGARRAGIRDAFDRTFEEVRWRELDAVPGDDGWSEYRCVRRGQIPRSIRSLAGAPWRADVVVMDVSRPQLATLGLARHTMLLDASNRGSIEDNRIFVALAEMVKTLLRAAKTAYVDLPGALGAGRTLGDAVAEGAREPGRVFT